MRSERESFSPMRTTTKMYAVCSVGALLGFGYWHDPLLALEAILAAGLFEESRRFWSAKT